jgi:hypothetical protein
MKHTKAPWTFTLDDRREKALINGCAPLPRSNEPVQWEAFAEVCITVDGRIKEEGLANLALFLAAPELLRQLRKVAATLEAIALKGHSIDTGTVHRILCEAEDLMDKANNLQWTVGD